MAVIRLKHNLASSPRCWQNYIKDFNRRWDNCAENHELELAYAEQQHFYDAGQELFESWSAKFTGTDWDHPGDLVFESDELLIMFVLRWS